MSTAIVTTVTRMVEALPDGLQERVAEHMRDYIEDLRDELHWDEQFSKSKPQLMAAARQARRQIAEGLAKPMDVGEL